MLKLPMALDLKTNTLIHISNVTNENKNQFEFICPKCKSPLIIKMGDIKTHHFAHKIKDCEINGETIMHLLAKTIISENSTIIFPIYNPVTLKWLRIEQPYTIHKIESSYEDIIPDMIININGRLVFIEVAFSHFIDKEKYEKLKRIGIETWEIDLRKLDIYNYDSFAFGMIRDIFNKESIIINLGDYRDYLNSDYEEFSKSNLLAYELVEQYNKTEDIDFSDYGKQYPLLHGNNYFKLIGTKNMKEYWLCIYHDKIDTKEIITVEIYYNTNIDLKSIHLVHYKLTKNNNYTSFSGGWYSEYNKFNDETTDNLDYMAWYLKELLNNKNKVNLKYNKYNDNYMLFGGIVLKCKYN